MATNEQLFDALRAKLYSIWNAPDPDTGDPGLGNARVAFASPGIAMPIDELKFGFSGLQDEVQRASAFANIVNDIPNPTGLWTTTGAKLWDVYQQVLDTAVLPSSTLTSAEQATLDRCLGYLQTISTVYDPITDQTTETYVDTPIVERYNGLMTSYQLTLMNYNRLQIEAQNSTDPAVVAEWNLNGSLYRSQVQAAYNRWVAGGKNTIERCYSVIDQLTGRDPSRLFARARDQLARSLRTDMNGEQYYFTKFFPSRFYDIPQWPKFEMSHTDIATTSTNTSTSWGGKAGIGFGLWSFGGGVNYASQSSRATADINNFSLKMEMMRLPLRRSWFMPTILTARSWKSDNATNLLLSDGGNPPQGSLIGYPTDVIMARNVSVRTDMRSLSNSYAASQFSASAKVGWGPFSVKGNYSRDTQSSSFNFTHDDEGFTVREPQIIAVIWQTLPKSPNPDPALNW